MNGWYYDSGWHWAGAAMMGVAMLLFVIFLVVVVLVVLRRYPGSRLHDGRPTEALRTLQDRFARGEIDEEEYQRRRDHLLR